MSVRTIFSGDTELMSESIDQKDDHEEIESIHRPAEKSGEDSMPCGAVFHRIAGITWDVPRTDHSGRVLNCKTEFKLEPIVLSWLQLEWIDPIGLVSPGRLRRVLDFSDNDPRSHLPCEW